MKETVYDKLVAMECQIDSHASDLYVKVTETSTKILWDFYPVRADFPGTFISNTDRTSWYTLPFCYSPWWRRRGME